VVVIPDDVVVRLELDRNIAVDLASVDNLAADAVDALSADYVPVDDSGVRHLSHLTGLKSLELDGTKITSSAASSIGKLTKLRYLGVHSTQIDDDGMTAVAALPELETLGLYGTGVADVGLKTLSNSPSLKAVYVGRTRITDRGVAELCKLKDLRALNLLAGDPKFRGNQPAPVITDNVVEALAARPSLEYLDLSGAALTDAGLERMAATLPNLRGLVLDFTRVTADGMRHLAKFANLERLRYQGMMFDDSIAHHFSSLSNLRELTGDIQFSDSGVKELSSLRNLEVLHLEGSAVTDASMAVLKDMRALKELSLQHTSVTDDGFAMLAGAKSLERVQLTRNRMTTRCVETLAQLPRLRQVGLMDLDARVDGEPTWKGLEALRSLEDELWLSACPQLSPEDFVKLSSFSKLKHFRVEGTSPSGPRRPVTDADVAQIARLDRLELLELTSTVVTDAGLAELAKLPSLRQLRISCLATEAGLATVAGIPSLEYLTIGSPTLTDLDIARIRTESPHIASIQLIPFELENRPVSRSTSDGFWRNRAAEERTALNALEGQAAPPLTATSWLNADEGATLEDFRGKVVLIDFWGTWCGPCIAQLPEIRRLHDAYGDRGLVVIGVHSTTGAETAAVFAKSNNLKWPIVLDGDDQSKTAYGVQSWPSYYLIDRRGLLRMADIFDGDRELAIQALLSENE
jgi:thiol-disulfide isomerase/thioredoxin/Leucine-rich repeat (LRR) protein